jgi:hypothetical protein
LTRRLTTIKSLLLLVTFLGIQNSLALRRICSVLQLPIFKTYQLIDWSAYVAICVDKSNFYSVSIIFLTISYSLVSPVIQTRKNKPTNHIFRLSTEGRIFLVESFQILKFSVHLTTHVVMCRNYLFFPI